MSDGVTTEMLVNHLRKFSEFPFPQGVRDTTARAADEIVRLRAVLTEIVTTVDRHESADGVERSTAHRTLLAANDARRLAVEALEATT